MKSPFKFLDAFTLEDKEVFFGRERETEALYEMVYETRMMLLYGMSGTGKTSLIQCGLAGKFDGPDWYPLWIRKQDDINESVRKAVAEATEEESNGNLVEAVSTLFRFYLRPVYLIFDQFEELFILGTAQEQQRFMEDIQALFQAELPCKIIFVMREEYLGQLYEFEKIIPTIFDFRLRVEPMNANRVKEVMTSSFREFNISLEGDREARLQQIIDNISGGRSRIQLTYLQVYLDMLYREDYQRTYGEKAPAEELPPLTLTESEIGAFGEIEDVLEKFIGEQEVALQAKLSEKFDALPANAVNTILDIFVTEEGTKRPLPYTRQKDGIQLDERLKKRIAELPDEVISETLTELEQRRLLRFTDDTIELAHDSLAALIDQRRTEEQRLLNDTYRRIAAAYREYRATGLFLNRKQLNSIDPLLDQLNLEEPTAEFIEKSRREIERQENEALRRQQAELEKERRLRAEAESAQQLAEENAQRSRKRTRLAAVIAMLAIVAAGIAYWQSTVARKAQQYAQDQEALASEKAEEATLAKDSLIYSQENERRVNYERYLENGKLEMQLGNYDKAITQFEVALDFDATQPEPRRLIDSCIQVSGVTGRYDQLMAAGETALQNDQLLTAMRNFQSAGNLNVNNNRKQKARNQEEATRNKMLPRFQEYVKNADIYYQAGNCQLAEDELFKARQLLPYLPGNQIGQELNTIRMIEKDEKRRCNSRK